MSDLPGFMSAQELFHLISHPAFLGSLVKEQVGEYQTASKCQLATNWPVLWQARFDSAFENALVSIPALLITQKNGYHLSTQFCHIYIPSAISGTWNHPTGFSLKISTENYQTVIKQNLIILAVTFQKQRILENE